MKYKVSATLSQQAFIDELKQISSEYTILDLSSQNLKLSLKSVEALKQIFAAIPATVTTLHFLGSDFYLKPPEALKQAFAAIPVTVTTLFLSWDNQTSWNNLRYKSVDKIIQTLNAMPKHVCINLEGNQLFQNRTKKEIDQILKGLYDGARFYFKNNGESDLVRALSPMRQLVDNNRLAEDVAIHILSFLPSDAQPQRCAQRDFFKNALNLVQHRLTLDAFLEGLNASLKKSIILARKKEMQLAYFTRNIYKLNLADLKLLNQTMRPENPHYNPVFDTVREEQTTFHRLFGDSNTQTWRKMVHTAKAQYIALLKKQQVRSPTHPKISLTSTDYQDAEAVLGEHAGRWPWRWGTTNSAKQLHLLFQPQPKDEKQYKEKKPTSQSHECLTG